MALAACLGALAAARAETQTVPPLRKLPWESDTAATQPPEPAVSPSVSSPTPAPEAARSGLPLELREVVILVGVAAAAEVDQAYIDLCHRLDGRGNAYEHIDQ